MNATRRLAKKGASVFEFTYEKGKASFQSNIIQGITILILLIYSGILLKYLPLNFLRFFEHIAVKIVMLVIIAFVGLYSPAIALFIAIALICTLQMAQRKRILVDMRPVTRESIENQIGQFADDMMSDTSSARGSTEGYENSDDVEGYDNSDDDVEAYDNYDSVEGYENDIQENMSNADSASTYSDSVLVQEPLTETYGQEYLDPEVMQANSDTSSVVSGSRETFLLPSDSYLPRPASPRMNENDVPQGYNDNTSCLPCNGGGNASSLNSQCGNVKTWENQFSAQGLGMDITGYQSTVGYPVN